jgi:urease alpha subunit
MVHPVSHCRSATKRDLVRNGTLADISIDPETYSVRVDGQVATSEPATRLPLAQAYYIV